MAQKRQQPRLPQLIGVSNYDKLRSSVAFNQYNPFSSNTFNKKAKKNVEASSMDDRYLEDDVYWQILSANGFDKNIRTGQRISYYGLDRKIKRQQMIRLSVHDIVDEVLTKLADEVVVTAPEQSPIELRIKNEILDREQLKEQFKKELIEYAQQSFDKIVKMYGFNQQGTEYSLWAKVWNFLTEGSLAYEIVWNDINKPRYIVGIHEIDSLDTESFYYNGVRYWKHRKMRSQKMDTIILYDTQIVLIDYAAASPNNRMSYLEHLMKSFNDLRIIDEATINWTITNSTFRQMMTIPTKGLSRTQAAAAINREMSRWNDEITYDSTTGEVSVNGQSRLQMMKSIYVGDGNSGKPEIENIAGDGPDFSDTGKNEFFEKRFYRAAKMPMSRFDGSGDSWNIDTRSTLREEIYFGNFVNRLRAIIKMLVLKPLRLELVARYPELAKDDAIDAFDIRFNSYNVFEELMKIDIMKEKIEYIHEIYDKFSTDLPEGGEMKHFSLEMLIEKFLPEWTQKDKERNDELLEKETVRMLKYQIRLNQLTAKYNPELTGVSATNVYNSDGNDDIDIEDLKLDLDLPDDEELEDIDKAADKADKVKKEFDKSKTLDDVNKEKEQEVEDNESPKNTDKRTTD